MKAANADAARGDFPSGAKAEQGADPVESACKDSSTTKVRYSRGTNKYDNAPAQYVAPTFDAFADAVLADRAAEKGLQYICAPAGPGEGLPHHRSKDSALPSNFIAFDFDGFDPPATYMAALAALAWSKGFAYTTASHQANAPRGRVLLAADRYMDRTERIRVSQAIEAWLTDNVTGEIEFDSTVYRAEQPLFCPPIVSETHHFNGDMVAVDQWLENAPELDEGNTAAQRFEAIAAADPVFAKLQELGMVKKQIKPGKIGIHCPCMNEHESKSSEGSTVYFLPHYNGADHPVFHCLHAHCADRPQREFIAALGLDPDALTAAAVFGGDSLLPEGAVQPTGLESHPVIEPALDEAAPIPPELLNPPGVLGEIAKFSLKNMMRAQPIFAVASALVTVSACTFDYRTPKGGAPNLYIGLVGGTAAGKDSPRDNVRMILRVLGHTDHMMEEASSEAALLRHFQVLAEQEGKSPVGVFLLDEYGKTLELANGASGGHLKSIGNSLLKLYGAGSGMYAGKRYANPAESIPAIDSPYLVLLATTTQSTLTDALSAGDVLSGMLNRPLFVITPDNVAPMVRDMQKQHTVPGSIIEKLRAILRFGRQAHEVAARFGPTGSTQGRVRQRITWDEGAKDLLFELSDTADRYTEADEQLGALWGRAFENAVKVASLVAIADAAELTKPRMTVAHAQWAIAWVKWCIKRTVEAIRANVADSPEQKRTQRVLRLITDCAQMTRGVEGDKYRNYLKRGLATKSWLMRVSHCSRRELEEAISNLVASDQIVEFPVKVPHGRPPVCYQVVSV